MRPEARHSRRRPEWASRPQKILPATAQTFEELRRQAQAQLEEAIKAGVVLSTHDDPAPYNDSVSGTHALNARVTNINILIGLGDVCEPPEQPAVLAWGVAAQIRYEHEEESMVVLLASPLDVAYAKDVKDNLVSIDSRAGAALLGKGPGETVSFCVDDETGGPTQPYLITVERIIPYREYVRGLSDQTTGNK